VVRHGALAGPNRTDVRGRSAAPSASASRCLRFCSGASTRANRQKKGGRVDALRQNPKNSRDRRDTRTGAIRRYRCPIGVLHAGLREARNSLPERRNGARRCCPSWTGYTRVNRFEAPWAGIPYASGVRSSALSAIHLRLRSKSRTESFVRISASPNFLHPVRHCWHREQGGSTVHSRCPGKLRSRSPEHPPNFRPAGY